MRRGRKREEKIKIREKRKEGEEKGRRRSRGEAAIERKRRRRKERRGSSSLQQYHSQKVHISTKCIVSLTEEPFQCAKRVQQRCEKRHGHGGS